MMGGLPRYKTFPSLLYPTMIYRTMQDAFVKGVMHRTVPEERPKISLKQKVGYVEEQVSVTRAKMSEMQIDGQTSRPEKECGFVMQTETIINELN